MEAAKKSITSRIFLVIFCVLLVLFVINLSVYPVYSIAITSTGFAIAGLIGLFAGATGAVIHNSDKDFSAIVDDFGNFLTSAGKIASNTVDNIWDYMKSQAKVFTKDMAISDDLRAVIGDYFSSQYLNGIYHDTYSYSNVSLYSHRDLTFQFLDSVYPNLIFTDIDTFPFVITSDVEDTFRFSIYNPPQINCSLSTYGHNRFTGGPMVHGYDASYALLYNSVISMTEIILKTSTDAEIFFVFGDKLFGSPSSIDAGTPLSTNIISTNINGFSSTDGIDTSVSGSFMIGDVQVPLSDAGSEALASLGLTAYNSATVSDNVVSFPDAVSTDKDVSSVISDTVSVDTDILKPSFESFPTWLSDIPFARGLKRLYDTLIYHGYDCVIPFPGSGVVPFFNRELWQPAEINLGEFYNNNIPQAIKLCMSFLLYLGCIYSVYHVGADIFHMVQGRDDDNIE